MEYFNQYFDYQLPVEQIYLKFEVDDSGGIYGYADEEVSCYSVVITSSTPDDEIEMTIAHELIHIFQDLCGREMNHDRFFYCYAETICQTEGYDVLTF